MRKDRPGSGNDYSFVVSGLRHSCGSRHKYGGAGWVCGGDGYGRYPYVMLICRNEEKEI